MMTVEDYSQWANQAQVFADSTFRRVLAVPLKIGDRVIGVINVTDDVRPGRYNEEEIQLVSLFAQQAAIAIHNARLYEKVQAELAERKRAEEGLAQERILLRTVIDNLPDAIYVKDTAMRKILVNRADLANIGKSEAEVLGKTDLELFPTEVAARFWADDQAVLESGQVILNREELLVNSHGQSYWLLTSKLPLRDNEGRLTGVVGIGRDITERKRVEESLRDKEERFRTIVENAEAGYFRIGRDGRFQQVNAAWLRMHGYDDPAQVIGQHFALTQNDMDLEAARTIVQRLLNDNSSLSGEFSRRCRDGSIGYHTYSINSVKEGGQIVGLEGFLIDITDRKYAEEALRNSERRYRLLFQNLTPGFALHEIIWDEAGQPRDYRFLEVNPAFEQLTGLKADDLIGRTVLEIMPDTEYYWIETYGQVALTGQTIQFENYSKVLGKYYHVIAYSPEPGRFATVFSDITERKQAEESLRESNRRLEKALQELKATQEKVVQQERLAAVGQLAAGIAHDFNNILTSILGFAELLQMSPDSPPSVRADLAHIIASGQRAAHLVRQILDFSRKSIRRPQPVELTPFIKEVAKFLGRTIPENIQLELQIEPGAYLVEADPAQLQQMLTNLVVNARDAMPAGGALRILLSRSFLTGSVNCIDCNQPITGEWIAIKVIDTGSGISPETLPHIFEPFFTTKPVGAGTGLGLAQVLGIVQQHAGHITVDSQVDQGTAFVVYLRPLPVTPKLIQPQATNPMQSGRGETILLVEDEPAVLKTAQAMLQYLGYQIITAGNGREALALYTKRRTEIALVLSDMVMPDMDGLVLLRSLREQNPAIKVVLMSGYPLDQEEANLLEQGVLDWFQKPLTLGILARSINQALGEVKQ
jgi:PAS domain S-box-containing protein